MLRYAWFVAALLVSGSASGANRQSSLTVGRDPLTGVSTATCKISVGGVDKNGTYSGVMIFWLASDGGTVIDIFNAQFQVEPTARTWTESSPGVYPVKAALKNQEVLVTALVPISFATGDQINCNARIDPGLQPVPVGATLYGADLRFIERTPAP